MKSGRPRCVVYVDGYNWYHAIFKHHPEWKWLNLETFFKSIRPHEEIAAVKLFSAIVVDVHGAERQKTYFKALDALPTVKITLGKFQEREVHCGAECKLRYIVQDEKKTDVNLAVEMLSDAIDGNADFMVAVTGDSDVQPAVEWITRRYSHIRILVYVPCLPNEEWKRRTDYYETRGLDVECKFLPLQNIPHHQLKPCIPIGAGENIRFLVRPSSWCVGGTSSLVLPS